MLSRLAAMRSVRDCRATLLSCGNCGVAILSADGVRSPMLTGFDGSVCEGLENENTRDRDEATESLCRGPTSPWKTCRLGGLVTDGREGAGSGDRAATGGAEGDSSGELLGLRDGLDGENEGDRLGLNVGGVRGLIDGLDGDRVGDRLGLRDGLDGDRAGDRLGLIDGLDGDKAGERLGLLRDGAGLGLGLMASRR